MQARAAILYSHATPLQIETITLPSPAAGQVVVKVAFSGVCHSQLMEARGKRGVDPYLPHLLGHEGSGTVVAVGEGVAKVTVGDDVILGWIKGTGMDVPGPRFEHGGRVINAGAVTTFTTHAIVAENRCVKVPDGVPMDLAVLFGCAIPTGAGIVINQVKPDAGNFVAVFGLGGIGISALLALGLFQCAAIIAVDVEETKLAFARECGATHTINAAKDDVAAELSRLTGGRGVDYAIEASGMTRTIEMAFSCVKKLGGLCVFASHPPAGEKIALDPHELISGKRIEGSWGGNCVPDRDIPTYAGYYREGRLPLHKLLGKRYRLEEVNHALADLEQRKCLRALIEME